MAPPPLPADTEVVKVLVVDDQASNLEVMDSLLAASGCRLVRAQSAHEALLALLDQEFAAIILDVKMPGMSGLELAALIKERRRTSHVPILFLTAHMFDERDVLRGYGTGAVDYLTKPVHASILQSKIAVFVELFRKTRALTEANNALRREVEDRERAEEALRHANAELERRVSERTEALRQADRRKDEFLASLAHELRNPLAPIRAAVEVLRLSTVTERESDQARAIVVRQVAHMARLIDDLLDVSRITCDKLVLRPTTIELAHIVATAVETSRPVIAERQHTLSTTLPAAPVRLYADPARLAQVLSNLLTNAAKYTPANGDVRIVAEAGDAELVIRVVDNGIGITKEALPRIFDLFVQGQHSSEHLDGGLGIGLTLARRLVEMHGGTLEAESAGPGHGSQFIVRLPILDDRAPQLHAGETLEADPVPGRRVLVVDDNQDAAEMLSVMLSAWGHETRMAHDGHAALDVGQAFAPDVVLLDLGLPGLDGYATAERIRETSWGGQTLLVAVTGWGQDSDIERSRAAGFDHHLVKPVAPEVLQAVVASGNLPDASAH